MNEFKLATRNNTFFFSQTSEGNLIKGVVISPPRQRSICENHAKKFIHHATRTEIPRIGAWSELVVVVKGLFSFFWLFLF